jgi:hypothetical protein
MFTSSIVVSTPVGKRFYVILLDMNETHKIDVMLLQYMELYARDAVLILKRHMVK